MKTRFDEATPVNVIPGHLGRFIETDHMTFVLWDIEHGAALPEHSHDNEQVVQLLSGEYLLTVEGKDNQLRAGDVFTIRGGERHSGRALTECRILDTFWPKRTDYTRYTHPNPAA
jgi:quercetin dioxygenase-like cupin family protein